MTSNREARATDETKVRVLVRRVLRSGGTDLDAVEQLVFLQQLDDPLGFTVTTDPDVERNILQEAFDVELADYVGELLSDDRLTREEGLRLRSSLYAAEGRLFHPEQALAPYKDVLERARS